MKILTRFLTMKNEFYFVSFITIEFPVLLNPSLPGNISPICRRYFRGNEKIVHRIQYKNFRLFKNTSSEIKGRYTVVECALHIIGLSPLDCRGIFQYVVSS